MRLRSGFGAWSRERHRQIAATWWPVLRQLLGWSSIAVGLLGLILPVIPGIPFVAAGVMLVGRRNPCLRRIAIVLKIQLRVLARQPGLRGRLGVGGQQMERELSRQFERVQLWLDRQNGR